MNLKIGIVGLPNAGKSTLFNALLKKQVADAAAYPFCTIEPNVGVVSVPDVRLTKLAEITMEEEKMDKLPPIIPAVVEFVDIAGLVKGASTGEGLGNKFLSHIREVDIICHVVRYFTDSTVVHVAETIDPTRGREIIETELILSDLQTLEKQVGPRSMEKDKYVLRKWDLIQQLKVTLGQAKLAKDTIIDPDDIALIRDLHLLTMKRVMFVANVDENALAEIVKLEESKTTRQADDVLPICAKVESELMSLSAVEQIEYLSSLGLSQSGLDRLIKRAYDTLGLISFLTCGAKEVRAWTIPVMTKAPQAAGTIHTDFEKKFIKADIVAFTDFVSVEGPASTRGANTESTRGGWKKSKELGKVRQEGREYVMQDGDVVEFKVGA